MKEKEKSDKELFNEIRKMTITELAERVNRWGRIKSARNLHSRYAFFLGAGASFQSGIKLAREMMDEFRESIIEGKRDELEGMSKEAQENWIRDNILSKDYGQLFEHFEDTPKGRHLHIQELVFEKEPSVGYVILADLMGRGYLSTVLTTNFDDMIFKASSNYLGFRPIICAYGVLDTELEVSSLQPKVLKLHGDYLYSKLANTAAEMAKAQREKNMAARVDDALRTYDLIVIGYSGSDASIMELLERYPVDDEKEFYWCYRREEDLIRPVLELLYEKKGRLVKINGFDEAMLTIYEFSGFKFDALLTRFTERSEFILREIYKFDLTFSKKVLATAIADIEKQFQPGKASEFVETFKYLNEGRRAQAAGDMETAKKNFVEAIECSPEYSATYYSLARLLEARLFDTEQAKKYYLQAFKVDPDDAYTCNRLGYLIGYTEPKRAEDLIRKAIGSNSNYAYAYHNLGELLVRRECTYEEAEQNFRRAIEIKPNLPDAYFRLYRLFEKTGAEQKFKALVLEARRNEIHLFEYLINSAVEYQRRAEKAEPDEATFYRSEVEAFINYAGRKPDKSDYDEARIFVLLGKDKEAIEKLKMALAAEDFEKIVSAQNEEVFATIKDDARFQEIVRSAEESAARKKEAPG
jgi:Tfp pilus assembly protein PilF/NAD-dependent SIR2 family protein deacetylase